MRVILSVYSIMGPRTTFPIAMGKITGKDYMPGRILGEFPGFLMWNNY